VSLADNSKQQLIHTLREWRLKAGQLGVSMRRTKKKSAQRLRLIVDTLPYETRAAMIEGLEQYDIIAGAYSDRDGGVCPMLAAHRCGGRTDLRSFARAWDRFTGAGRARRASERELRTLAAQLESSLWREDQARYAHLADVERLDYAHQPGHHSERVPEPSDETQSPGRQAPAGQPPATESPATESPATESPATQLPPDEQVGAWLIPFRDLEQYARALRRAVAQIDERPSEPARKDQFEVSS
jgi:hypothetical protein